MTAVDFSVCVVLPASGTGERFGTDPPKQFNTLLGNPLILHTINIFNRLSWVKHIILPVNKSHMTYVLGLIAENDYTKVTVIEGCHTRHRSIYQGIQEIKKVCSEPDVVIIHDVVRIFAEEETIRDLALAAKTYGAAGVTRPLVSTVISSDSEGFLRESLDRSQYCASEMPQAFIYSTILTAYQKATEDDFDHGTECLLLTLKYTGTRAKLVQGPSSLWKVTYRKDLYAAEGMLKETDVKVVVKTMKKTLRELIHTACRKKRLKVLPDLKNGSGVPNSFITSVRPCDFKNLCESITVNVFQLYAPNRLSMILPAVILVAFTNTLSAGDEISFRNICREIGKKSKVEGILNGIILQNEESCQVEAAEMIASLLWNRDSTLTGQVFDIRQ